MNVAHARDITDERFIDAMLRDTADRGVPACYWTMAEREGWPEKVVLAKAKRLIHRGTIAGCACGCRGDFTLRLQ